MASKKFKLTGFARFFLVMIILAPLAYVGASYANGEDGIENFKNLFKGKISLGTDAPEERNTIPETTKAIEIPESNTQDTESNIEEDKSKDLKIQALIEKNKELENELSQTVKELNDVKAQLRTIKDAIGQTE